jgi:hypothetical protein
MANGDALSILLEPTGAQEAPFWMPAIVALLVERMDLQRQTHWAKTIAGLFSWALCRHHGEFLRRWY